MNIQKAAAASLLLLPSLSHGWMLPVSSPIMSLPVIESTPQHPSATLPISISMPPFSTRTTRDGKVKLEQDKKTRIAKIPNVSNKVAPFKVFCDLDGVLVDFEHGIKQLFPPDTTFLPQLADLEKSTMWKSVREADAFFEHLPWTKEGKDLWMAIQHLQPDILTGVPIHPSSRIEKYRWCLRELRSLTNQPIAHVDMACPWTHGHRPLNRQSAELDSPQTLSEDVCRVITCWSSNKHYESGPGHVLIDDRESLREPWEQKGGIFIHHQPGNLKGTLEQLERYGILLTV